MSKPAQRTKPGRTARPGSREAIAAMTKLANEVRQIITAAAPTLREDVQPGYIRYRDRGVVVCAIMVHEDYCNVQFYFASQLAGSPSPGKGKPKRMENVTLRTPEDLHRDALVRLLRQARKPAVSP